MDGDDHGWRRAEVEQGRKAALLREFDDGRPDGGERDGGRSASIQRPRQLHPGPLDWGWSSIHSFDLDPKNGRVLLKIVDGSYDLTVLMNWHGLLNK